VIVEKTACTRFSSCSRSASPRAAGTRWSTALQQFKDRLRQEPADLLCCRSSARIPRYERLGIRDLCEQIHACNKANDVARVTTEMYLSDCCLR